MFKHLKHQKHHPKHRPFRWIGWLMLIMVIIIVVILVLGIRGCPRAPKEEIKNQTEQTISEFDGINIYTLDLDEIIEIGPAAIPALAEMLDSENQSVRWAAVMSLSAIGHKLDAKDDVLPYLKKALNDSDVSVRVTAAELVMSFGDKDGIPVLIEALDYSEEQMKPSEPPMPVKSQAAIVLIQYTNQDFQVDKAAWQAWWTENKETLQWNEENGKFE